MLAIFKLFWDVCLLRRGPQDVPVAISLFVLVLGLNLVIDTLAILFRTDFAQAVYIAIVIHIFMLGVLAALLALFGYAARIQQTLTAYLGTGVIINALHLPLSILATLNPGQMGMLGFVLLFFLFWSLTISSHILRHALAIHVLPASVLAIGYLMLNILVFDFLLPQAD